MLVLLLAGHRGARHRCRRGSARSQQPHPGRAGAAPHPGRARLPGHRRAAARGGPRSGARDDLRPRFRRGASTERSRPAEGHVDRHRVPARGGCGRGRPPGSPARCDEPRAARDRGRHARAGAGDRCGRRRRGAGMLARAVPARLAPRRGRHRRRPRQGPAAPPGLLLRARGRRTGEGFGSLDRCAASSRRARHHRRARTGTAARLRRARRGGRGDAARSGPASIRGRARVGGERGPERGGPVAG